jgi:hypothetical protein
VSAQPALVPVSVPAWDSLPRSLTWREKIAWLGLRLSEGPQSPCPIEHTFGHGLYIRRMTIPAGTLFLGRAHLKGHQCALLSGSLIWILPKAKRYIEAPMTVVTEPGFHMVLYALTDVVGQTSHPNPTDSTDVEALEATIFEPAQALRELGMAVDQRLVSA